MGEVIDLQAARARMGRYLGPPTGEERPSKSIRTELVKFTVTPERMRRILQATEHWDTSIANVMAACFDYTMQQRETLDRYAFLIEDGAIAPPEVMEKIELLVKDLYYLADCAKATSENLVADNFNSSAAECLQEALRIFRDMSDIIRARAETAEIVSDQMWHPFV